MSLTNRIKRLEMHIPLSSHEEIGEVELWLIENDKEFVENVRQLYRLNVKAGLNIKDINQWEDTLRNDAYSIIERMNKKIEYYRNEGLPL